MRVKAASIRVCSHAVCSRCRRLRSSLYTRLPRVSFAALTCPGLVANPPTSGLIGLSTRYHQYGVRLRVSDGFPEFLDACGGLDDLVLPVDLKIDFEIYVFGHDDI